MTDSEKIVLGSGSLYIMEFTGTIPENTVIETEENRLGYIQGGASLEYKPETYTAEDDLGFVSITKLTKETVTLKSGVMTWHGETLKKLCSTARVTEDESQNTRTVKIGGINNQDGKNYIIRFIQDDPKSGTIRVTIVGKNTVGITLAWAKDKETVVDAEFTASPLDADGTLVIYEEDILDDAKSV